MQFNVFINFDGNCRKAVEFYAKAFNSEVKNLMTYGEAPPEDGMSMPEADKNKVMYADIQIGGLNVMFMDMPTGMPLTIGNNVQPTISTSDKDEVKRIFEALKEGGQVNAELEKTFFSDLYGMITDKFGVIWQILYFVED